MERGKFYFLQLHPVQYLSGKNLRSIHSDCRLRKTGYPGRILSLWEGRAVPIHILLPGQAYWIYPEYHNNVRCKRIILHFLKYPWKLTGYCRRLMTLRHCNCKSPGLLFRYYCSVWQLGQDYWKHQGCTKYCLRKTKIPVQSY